VAFSKLLGEGDFRDSPGLWDRVSAMRARSKRRTSVTGRPRAGSKWRADFVWLEAAISCSRDDSVWPLKG
jgi:hypothetical protein